MKRIARGNLKRKLKIDKPNNTDSRQGYALVGVLKRKDFLDHHIQGSINIPEGMESEFSRFFSKAKEIIIYGASPECPASNNVVNELIQRGFTNVSVYEGGMSEWNKIDNQLEINEAAIRALHV